MELFACNFRFQNMFALATQSTELVVQEVKNSNYKHEDGHRRGLADEYCNKSTDEWLWFRSRNVEL